ncbi:MAG: histidine phosphatase family protein [Bacteroidota bacterium]
MERRLYIIRHGKSSWDNEGLDDIDRPLASRGLRNAEDMALRLKEAGRVPQLVYSSPANRALNTAQIMCRQWGLGPAELQIHDSLYMAYVSEIREVVSIAPGGITDLAIFGHNPSFTLYANQFLADPLDNLPTAGVVVLTLESESWSKLSRAQVKEALVDFPKKNRRHS